MTTEEFKDMTDGFEIKLISQLTGKSYITISHYRRGKFAIPASVAAVVKDLHEAVQKVAKKHSK